MAKDAFAILRSRARSHPRVNWATIAQVFPGLSADNFRLRIKKLRARSSERQYLAFLEEAWHQIWLRDRHEPTLSDIDESSLINFDLCRHIGHLRSCLDKSVM